MGPPTKGWPSEKGASNFRKAKVRIPVEVTLAKLDCRNEVSITGTPNSSFARVTGLLLELSL